MAAALTKIYMALLFSIPLTIAMVGVFCVRRAYSTYKLLGGHTKNAPFLVFYTALQSPWYASQFWGQADIAETLSPNLKSQVVNSRRQINYGIAIAFSWIVFVFSVGALAAYLRRKT